MDQNIYNIYCDESRVENPRSENMVIGALFISRKKKKNVAKKLKCIFQKHNFNYELKWTKVHKKYFGFYKEIIDFFCDEIDLNFRCIVVNKNVFKTKKEVR